MHFFQEDILGDAFEDALEVLQDNSTNDNLHPAAECKMYTTILNSQHQSDTYIPIPSVETAAHHWTDSAINNSNTFVDLMHRNMQSNEERQLMYTLHASRTPQKHGRNKLRLYEYIYEALCDINMMDCIKWVDQANGIFQFVSKNKEKLAELWGKEKGNRKLMTYQKMARALRNYGRTGEVMKIKKKLTYQFSEVVLQRLSPAGLSEKETIYCQYLPQGMEYCNSHHCWEVNTYAYNNNVYPFSHQYI
ncbi:transcription factor Spi-C isoform X2 [Mixophyes fleayi]|uniref:transcription factor Spi-C isoform X2 n=1 Tax=Mixophyes fleayi TaxID=3061075 RepID=UPI003F4DC3F4